MFWGNFGQSFFISWFSADIQRSLGLSASECGMAHSLATLCSALTLIGAGGLLDKIELRKYIVGVAVGFTCAALIMFSFETVLTIVTGLYLVRLFGQGLLPHTGQTVMVKHFSLDRGKALAIATSGVPVGEIVLPLLQSGLFRLWAGNRHGFLLLFSRQLFSSL